VPRLLLIRKWTITTRRSALIVVDSFDMKFRRKFKTVRVSAPAAGDFKNALRICSTSSPHDQPDGGYSLPQEVVKSMAAIATNAWRAKTKMVDTLTGEIREEMKRVGRHIEAIYRNLADLGVVIRDHTGEPYDEGQPMKVVASKPTAGLDKKRVSETLIPSIFWNDRLIQNGEIEIAVPMTEEISSDPKTL
jgi:hypothetical protein